MKRILGREATSECGSVAEAGDGVAAMESAARIARWKDVFRNGFMGGAGKGGPESTRLRQPATGERMRLAIAGVSIRKVKPALPVGLGRNGRAL
jgi:hypothetical protein